MRRAFYIPWYKQKIHVSWLISAASVGLLAGVVFAPKFGMQFVDTAWLLTGCSLLFVSCIKPFRSMVIVAIIAGTLVGLWRGSGEYIALAEYAPYVSKHVQVSGTVSEDTTFGPKGDQRLRVGNVHVDNQVLTGTIWVSTIGKNNIKRGDIVVLKGVLNKGFGNIPAVMFRSEVVAISRPVPGDVGRQVRDWFGGGVHRAMSAADAEFAMAYLLGQRITLSDTLNDQLRTVGLIHAVVASGFHLTVLMVVVRRLFVNRSKYLTALFSVGMIVGFIMITGFSPSMTRAGLVAGLSLFAWYYGRVMHPLVLLPFAAALTVLYKPAYLWGDVGWYLSFAAFSGVIVLAPLLHNYFWGANKRPGVIREVVIATIAAQIVTLPITIHAFGYYSMYALIANVLVVPLIPYTMLLTFISGIAGLVVPQVAIVFGLPVVWLLRYMTWVVDKIAHLPGAKTELAFGNSWIITSYFVILLASLYLWRVTGHDFRKDTLLQKDL